MCKYAKESGARSFIIGTEEGILYRLRRDNPAKEFVLAYDGAVCPNMKLNTLDRLYASLKEEKHEVTVPEAVAKSARKALEKMFEVK
jgi:quinolinate synthase